jgi:hypothetical protein
LMGLNPLGRWTVTIATRSTIAIGILASGMNTPRSTARPPRSPTQSEFAERGLRHAHDLGSSLGFSYQPETPRLLMMAQLARILWLQDFPDQASVAAVEALAAAQERGHPFAMITALALAGVPVALWTGAVVDARRRVDLLSAHIARIVGNQRTKQWGRCFAVWMRLLEGNESEKLAAAFLEPRLDFNSVPHWCI